MWLMDGVQPTILGMCFMMNVPLEAATSIHRRLIGSAENQAEQDDTFRRTYLEAIFMYTYLRFGRLCCQDGMYQTFAEGRADLLA